MPERARLQRCATVVDRRGGRIATFAGDGSARHDGDGGPATTAGIFGARAVAADEVVHVLERQGSRIRRIHHGVITTVAGTGAHGYDGDGGPARDAVFDRPKEMALDPAGNAFVVDTENHAIRLIDAARCMIRTIAGGVQGAHGDNGLATAAGLARPHGAVVGPDGAVFIADSENHRVRVIRRAV